MIVWRVENHHREGPYNCSTGTIDQGSPRWYQTYPFNDPLLEGRFARRTFDDVFGFKSIDDYIKWFNKKDWRKWLKSNNFMLKSFDVYDMTVGECQLMFSRSLATQLESFDPTAFDHMFGDHWEYR